jgi:hypothetical protein
MLIWLASYPRSGNTFVRVVLKAAFGIETRSLSGAGDDRVFSDPRVADAVGHIKSERFGAELIEEARQSSELVILKTHEPPPTADSAIYIVRDGRSAIVSYHHYLSEIEHLQVDMESIIEGRVYAGSWSDHFNSWRPIDRPHTLFLRFEDMVARPDELVGRLSGFMGVQPLTTGVRSFTDLHGLFPQFFRSGSDERNIREIAPYRDLFMRRHGDLMRRLQYDVGD